MRHYIYSAVTVVLACLGFASCTDNDYTQLDKGRDVLTLTSEQNASVLEENSHAESAIALNWTTGNNYGSGNRISYKLELAKGGTNFANAYVPVNEETQVYAWSATQENLNDLLLDKLGGEPGVEATIDARVTAIVSGIEDVQTSELSFTVTPYKPVTTTLYLIGDATPNGWNADNATEMTRSTNGLFEWEGTLSTGEFKFITTKGSFLPSYGKTDDGSLVLRTSDDEPDGKWNITEAHDYKIVANLLSGTVSIEKTDGVRPAFSELYFVGNTTGWGFVKMKQDALDKFLFRLGYYFDNGKGGEFKFGTASGSWENMYKATQANAPYTDQNMTLVKGYDPDNKWYLQDDECGKAYKICLDIRTGKERMMMTEFTPYQMIYLVGDATPNGWDIANATAMTATASPYTFTWTGTLNAGELKFTCDKQADWAGAWFMPSKGGEEPTGEEEDMLFIDKSDDTFKDQYPTENIGDVDNKWQITTSGTYTITLDQLHETVTISKN